MWTEKRTTFRATVTARVGHFAARAKKYSSNWRRLARYLPFLVLFATTAVRAQFAGGGGDMPWEGPLETLMESLTGPVAKVIGVVAIFVVGIGIAFAESGGMLRKALWLVMGLTIAFNAASLMSDFLGGPA